jgi:hypothetical protein
MRKPSKSISNVEEAEKQPKVDKRVEGKSFIAKREDNGLYSIRLTAGGEVPDVLKGYFTSGVKASQAAEAYLLRKNSVEASS